MVFDEVIKLAKALDALRVVPRLIIIGYSMFTFNYIWFVTKKYFEMDLPDWQESSFVVLVIMGLLAFLGKVTMRYMETGGTYDASS